MPETTTAAGERLAEIRARHAALAGRDWSPAAHSHASKGCRCLSCYDDPTGWVVDHPGALDCEERVSSDTNDFGRDRESCDSGPTADLRGGRRAGPRSRGHRVPARTSCRAARRRSGRGAHLRDAASRPPLPARLAGHGRRRAGCDRRGAVVGVRTLRTGLISINLEEPSMTTLEVPAVVPHRGAQYPRNPKAPLTSMTRRQKQALLLAANGNTNAVIAHQMGVGEDTVSGLLTRAYRKLGATDRAQAVALALRTGVLGLDEIVLPEPAERSAPSASP